MAIESLILGVGGFVFLLILAGAFLAVQEAKAGSFHTFDFFFLAGIAIAFIVANYLWFFCQRTRSEVSFTVAEFRKMYDGKPNTAKAQSSKPNKRDLENY